MANRSLVALSSSGVCWCALFGSSLLGCGDDSSTFAASGGTTANGTVAMGGAVEQTSGIPTTSGGTTGGGTTAIASTIATTPAINVTLTPPPDGLCRFPANYSSGTGSLTWYLFKQGSAEVNCSYNITSREPDAVEFVATGGGQYFAAMNTADYSTAAMCGACVEVTRDGAATVTATVVDQCPVGSNPKCVAGHLDLSQAAFLQVGTEVEGYLGTGNTLYKGSSTRKGVVAWRYIPCPSVGNVSVRYKEPSNLFWNEFLVENHVTPIAQFEVFVGGVFVVAQRKAYNYFIANEGDFEFKDWPVQVRITDINGATIVGSIPQPVGVPRVDFGVQFPACTP